MEEHERAPTLLAFGYHFVLMCCYYIIQPVRDTLGVEDVDKLPHLFMASLVVMIAANPLFSKQLVRPPASLTGSFLDPELSGHSAFSSNRPVASPRKFPCESAGEFRCKVARVEPSGTRSLDPFSCQLSRARIVQARLSDDPPPRSADHRSRYSARACEPADDGSLIQINALLASYAFQGHIQPGARRGPANGLPSGLQRQRSALHGGTDDTATCEERHGTLDRAASVLPIKPRLVDVFRQLLAFSVNVGHVRIAVVALLQPPEALTQVASGDVRPLLV